MVNLLEFRGLPKGHVNEPAIGAYRWFFKRLIVIVFHGLNITTTGNRKEVNHKA